MSRYPTVCTPQYVCHSMCTPLMDAQVYVCVRVRVCGCAYVFMYVCVYLPVHACVRASMCVCHMMYVYMCLSRQHHSTTCNDLVKQCGGKTWMLNQLPPNKHPIASKTNQPLRPQQ